MCVCVCVCVYVCVCLLAQWVVEGMMGNSSPSGINQNATCDG